MMKAKYIEYIINYLNNNCSDIERLKIERLKASDDNFLELFNDVEQFHSNQITNNHTIDVEQALQSVDKKLNLSNRNIFSNGRRSAINRLSRIAAAVVLCIGLGYVAMQLSDRHGVAIEMVSHNESTTSQQLLLADGTKVWLNSGAKLTYADKFNEKTRTIKLLGEAYFEVARNINKPFIIEASGSTVKVLGTSFNMESTANNTIVRVNSGKVQLKGIVNSVFLTKNQSATLIKESDNIVQSESTSRNYKSWFSGKLSFTDVSLSEVCNDLSKHFDLEVSLPHHNDSCLRFTGNFKNPTIDQLIESIEFATGKKLRYKK